MNPERIIGASLLVLMMMAAGCTGVDGTMPRFMAFSEQERTLDEARVQLRAGKERQTRILLEKVIDGKPMTGVTDEALFRLALLNLNEGFQRSQSLLEKLAVTYPDSIWSRQAAPLLAHLAEHKVLRNRNYSLNRDNKEMRQSLEQLKRLDLELEQKIKR